MRRVICNGNDRACWIRMLGGEERDVSHFEISEFREHLLCCSWILLGRGPCLCSFLGSQTQFYYCYISPPVDIYLLSFAPFPPEDDVN